MNRLVEVLVEKGDYGGRRLGGRSETDEASVVETGIAELLHGRDLGPV